MSDFWLLVIGGSWHGQGEQNRKKGQCKQLEDKRRDGLYLGCLCVWILDVVQLIPPQGRYMVCSISEEFFQAYSSKPVICCPPESCLWAFPDWFCRC